MRRRLLAHLCIAAAVLVAPGKAPGQSRRPKATVPAPAATKDTILRTTARPTEQELPPRGDYRHDQPIVTKFDRFSGKTTVSMPTRELGVGSFKVAAFFIFDGERAATAPDRMELLLLTHSESWQYLDSHRVTFLLDGKEALSPDANHDGSVGSGYVLEYITMHLTRSQVAKLAAANSIEVQIGTTEGSLNDDTIQGFRDLASRMRKSEY